MNWNRIRNNLLPRLLWAMGGKYIDYAISYWHLRVRKLPPYWSDADERGCALAICRYCGKDSSQDTV